MWALMVSMAVAAPIESRADAVAAFRAGLPRAIQRVKNKKLAAEMRALVAKENREESASFPALKASGGDLPDGPQRCAPLYRIALAGREAESDRCIAAAVLLQKLDKEARAGMCWTVERSRGALGQSVEAALLAKDGEIFALWILDDC